jgi:hypothetical protein
MSVAPAYGYAVQHCCTVYVTYDTHAACASTGIMHNIARSELPLSLRQQ